MTIDEIGEGRPTALGPIVLALFVGSISSSATPIAAPEIASEFDAVQLIPWFVSSFLLASTIAAPVFGKLGDLHGRKTVSLAALGIFGISSFLAGIVTSMEFMIAARALQGFSAGGLMVSSMAMIADVVRPNDRAKIHGLLSWVFAAATISGPLVGGLVVDALSWRWVFWLNVPCCILVGLAITRSFPNNRPDRRREFDLKGAAILVVMLTGFVAAAGFGTETVHATIYSALSLVVALLAAYWFATSQRHASEPILPLYLFRIPEYATANAFIAILSAVMFVEITYLPIFLQKSMGMTAAESGAHLLPLLFGVLLSSTAAGRFASKTGNAKGPLVSGCAVMVVAMVAISSLNHTSPLVFFHIATAALGIGLGPATSLAVPVIQNVVPPSEVGVATASAGMFRSIGGSVGIMIFGTIFAAAMPVAADISPEQAVATAISTVFLAGAGACVVGLAVLARLNGKLGSDPHEGTPTQE